MANIFEEVLTLAVRDLSENGYTDQNRLDYWMAKLKSAANEDLPSYRELDKRMRRALEAIFQQATGNQLYKFHPDVPKYTLQSLIPSARMELERKILASSQLIKLNREQAIDKTLQRFSGWATSVPAGGSKAVDKVDVKSNIKKSLQQVKYEVRRVDIDQGHKLVASINAVIARGTGAIAMKWRSNWKQAGYDYRPDHKSRDGCVYLIRGSWALEQGLIKPMKDRDGKSYTDQITMPAEEVYCRCSGSYYISLRELPSEMLTAKGKQWLEEKNK